MITFKVVYVNHHGHRLSAVVDCNIYLCKCYTPEEWTVADVGGLLSFTSLEDAKQFLHDRAPFEIWQTEAEDEVPLGKCSAVAHGITLEQATECWIGISSEPDRTWPKGTVAHRKLRLVKKVWPEYTNQTEEEQT